MQLNILTTALLLLGGTNLIEARHCFGGHSLNINVMMSHAHRACAGYKDANNNWVKGRFQGYFGPGESRKVCVPDSRGKFDMEVFNTNTRDGFDIKDEDCTAQLHKIIQGCLVAAGPLAYGGEDTVSGWYFKADANSGSC